MKIKTVFLLFVLLLPGLMFAQSTSISINKLPENLEEFLELRRQIANTPEGGAMMFICAMIMYSRDEALGMKAYTIALDNSELSSGTVYKGYKPAYSWNYYFDQVKKFPYLGYIYINETDFSNGYIPQKAPYSISFSEIRELKENQVKVFIFTTSGNLPRPLTLYRNNRGIWKAKDAKSLFVGPSKLPPVEKADDDL